ncbi:MAG: error-prone DNA polymerase [Alphaproteobacteria bacterium]|nr:MAG: error-prone DNA polymerase [Alphaproteobacteria bacterium]
MSSTPAYAELQVTSNFSFLRGASHPEELVLTAAALGHRAIALTDRNSLAGVVRAHEAVRELAAGAGLRLLVGARLDLQDGASLLAYPVDRAAYGRLCRLLTTGKRRAPKGECHLTLDDVIEWGEGLVVVALPPEEFSPARVCTAASPPPRPSPIEGEGDSFRGPVESPPPLWGRDRVGGGARAGSLRASVPLWFSSFLKTLAGGFPGRAYLAASWLHRGDDARRIAALALLADECGTPLVATNDVHYHVPERRALQDVVTCIREGCTIDEAGFRLLANAERHLKPPAEMARLFADWPEAVARTVEIAERCRFSLDELRYEYPDELTGAGRTPQQELELLTWQGAAIRYPAGVPEKVKATIAHELRLIEKLDYAPYFLTVHDIVRFARSKDILCQGRGSAANSAVCYCLQITGVDPARHDLLFERFVSAARNEPPDIDVDFEHERREEVIQYIYRKYGRERAGIAATVICYRGRGAIREVGKALGLSLDTVSALSGTIWGWSREGAAEAQVRELGLDPTRGRLALALKLARQLMGFPRHLSQHVGGFVMTRGRLDEVVPIENAAMAERTVVEWDKDDLAALGILKVDVLGLGMLTCLSKGFHLIGRHWGKAYELATVPPEDPAVYDMLSQADSIGVFQVESRAQMNMLPRLKPQNFYDLVIEVAIVRPGPIQGDMVHPFLRRREKKEPVSYPSPELEAVLGKTLGVPLFQEQAMKIAIVAAGFTPDEADRLRRAMATFKKVGTIHSFETKLIDGMVGRGYDRDFAERCFRQIEGFGEYGFPESHAASFALLVYVSAWMKRHYPAAFAAALLNSQPMGFYAPAQIVRDAEEHGVEILPVDVNFSDWDCTLEPFTGFPEENHRDTEAQRTGNARAEPAQESMHAACDATGSSSLCLCASVVRPSTSLCRRAEWGRPGQTGGGYALRLGFRQIKGFAKEDAERLVAARGNGYMDPRALWRRAGLDARALERLARADAFRSTGLGRREALWAVKAAAPKPLPLFDAMNEEETGEEPEVALPAMSLGEQVSEDYTSLKLSLKAHPLALLRGDVARQGYAKAEALAHLPVDRRVRVAGLVLVRQRPGTASGVIFATLEDETGIANVIIWSTAFERFRRIVLTASLMGIEGRLQREEKVIHVVAEKIVDLSHLLRGLGTGDRPLVPALTRADHFKNPGRDPRDPPDAGTDARRPKPAAPIQRRDPVFTSRDFR